MNRSLEVLSYARDLLQSGKFNETIRVLQEYCDMVEDDGSILLQLARLHRKAGHLSNAEACYRKALNRGPQDVCVLCELGTVLSEHGNQDEALHILTQAKELDCNSAQVCFALGNAYRHKRLFSRAAEEFKAALQCKEDFFAARVNLGLSYRELRQYTDAIEQFQAAIALHTSSIVPHVNLGILYNETGQFKEAQEVLLEASHLSTTSTEVLVQLAHSYIGMQHYEAAEKTLQKALLLDPGCADLLNGLGNCCMHLEKLSEAREYYLSALQTRPDFAEAHYNLGTIMREWNLLDEGIICFKNAERFNPLSDAIKVNCGECLMASGELEDAEVYFRKALEVNESNKMAQDNLLLIMNYNPAYSREEIFEAHQRWGLAYPVPSRSFPNKPDPDKILRIGYVSSDFCNHPSASFIKPILANHDPDQVQTYCYSHSVHSDVITGELMCLASEWREISHLSDNAVCELIGNDQIDILFDCNGHMNGNRLGIFAQNAAPLQITGIGYPNTTGLQSITYRLTDGVTDPFGEDLFYTETLLRHPVSFCCYAPPAVLPITELPALSNGFVTFGSLHTVTRLNKEVIELWAALLHAVPESRMLLFRTTLTNQIIERVAGWFNEFGIESDRVVFRNVVPPEGHRAIYASIDISLDTFPWSGHTTACESLWMGVPVITMRGNRHAGRMVSSVLTTIGLRDWIVEKPDDYLHLACEVAGDLEQLNSLRKRLRSIMLSSELCNGKHYTAELERLYRKIWQNWCFRNGK